MIRKSLVLLFLVPCYSTAEYSSFIASFQSQGYWSEHEYLEYKDELPEMKSFTVCHWEKTQFLSDSFNTIWAYCHHLSVNDLSLRCMEKRTGDPFNTFYMRWQLWVKWIFRLPQSLISLRQPCQLTRLRLSVPCQCQKDNLRPSKKSFTIF